MATPVTNWRATDEDKRRIKRIKHCTGYLTDAKAIRKALEHFEKHLSSSSKPEQSN